MTTQEALAQYAQRAALVCGPVRWIDPDTDETFELRISNIERSWWGIFASPDEGTKESFCGFVTAHEALCLWREHLREWIAKHRIQVIAWWQTTAPLYVIMADYPDRGDSNYWYGPPDSEFRPMSDDCPTEYSTLDEALIAAVEAGKERA